MSGPPAVSVHALRVSGVLCCCPAGFFNETPRHLQARRKGATLYGKPAPLKTTPRLSAAVGRRRGATCPPCPASCPPGHPCAAFRSEEHTSELQSRGHLVCRLLLEKKNSLQASHLQYACTQLLDSS